MSRKSTTTMTAKNKRFWALSKADQRVAVAKDVIKQLDAKFYLAQEGTYLEVLNLDHSFDSPEKLDLLFGELKKQEAICSVCGIGGCFVSLAKLGNSLTSEEVYMNNVYNGKTMDHSEMRPFLQKVFSKAQLSLIENAFEQSEGFQEDFASSEKRRKAASFGDKYDKSDERLKAIMKNIIQNKGTFKP